MHKFLILCFSLFMISLVSCKQKTKEVVAEPVSVDTVTNVKLDSVAVTKKHVERHAKVKPTHSNKEQTAEDKNVVVDTDPSILEAYHEEAAEVAESHINNSPRRDTPSLTDGEGFYFLAPYWAKYPGGEESLDKFLSENLKYPRKALAANIEGTVYAVLYVDEEGNIIDVKFPGKKLGHGLEEEVFRVLCKMPKWEAGTNGDVQVKSKFVLPVKFEIK